VGDVRSQAYCNTIEVDLRVKYVLIHSDNKCGDGIWSIASNRRLKPVSNTLLTAGLKRFDRSILFNITTALQHTSIGLSYSTTALQHSSIDRLSYITDYDS